MIELIDRVREALVDLPLVQEKRMFGGTCFLVDDKLCICVNKHEMLCRVDPENSEDVLEMDGIRPIKQRARTAKGYFFVHEDVLANNKDFNYWVKRALDYNKFAKASKKR